MATPYNVSDISMNGTGMADNLPTTTTTGYNGRLGYGPLELYTEFLVAYYLNRYYLRVLCAIGVVCNAAVFLTIYAIKPFTTSSFYVAFLAVVDALALIMKLIYVELTREIEMGDAGCKFMLFFGNFTVQYANWVLVIMTLERFVAVWFPLKVNRISTMTKAKITVIITAVVLTAFNLHFLWTYQASKTSCGPKPEHVIFIVTVWPWLDALVFGIAPCLLLIVPNGLIIYSLRRAIAAQKTLTSSERGGPSRSYHQTQLTAMLVTVAIAGVCCLMPGSIFFIVKPYWDYKQSLHQRAKYMLVSQIMFLLADCNHALNFFFFFLGGKRFRKMFMDFVCCRLKKQKRKPPASTYISRLSVRTPSTSPLSVSTSSLR